MEFQFTEGRVFSVDEKQDVIAEATYHSIGHNEVDIDHTYVNPAYRGQGVAGILMQAVAAYLRDNGLKAVGSCSYANAWFHKNRETFGDVILKVDESRI
ncbi:MAG TPA: GNAT family N-acetyltransferase [Eubacteriales bacterium]|nr:GNAT family N-acetyltransferase [Eubacteriales bacterium]